MLDDLRTVLEILIAVAKFLAVNLTLVAMAYLSGSSCLTQQNYQLLVIKRYVLCITDVQRLSNC